ncbi:MAG: hypothetical protein ACUVXJ_18865, partial [Phycisphaerae bacterium]
NRRCGGPGWESGTSGNVGVPDGNPGPADPEGNPGPAVFADSMVSLYVLDFIETTAGGRAL